MAAPWQCSFCTFVNPADAASTCSVCALPRAVDIDAPPAASAASSTPAKKPKKSSATGARASLATADPWSCARCTFANDAQHEMCSLCAAPRPTAIEDDDLVAGTVRLTADTIGATQRRQSSAFVTCDVVTQLQTCWRTRLSAVALQRRPIVALSSDCDHVTQRGSAGSGWACGYRNIQICASAMLRRPALRAAMFGGVGMLPDVPSLQAWLEAAWRAGFDAEGAAQLGGSVCGSSKWIGAGEAATLFRSFGIPARLIMFHAFDSPFIQIGMGLAAAARARRACALAEEELKRECGMTPDEVLRPWLYTGGRTPGGKAKARGAAPLPPAGTMDIRAALRAQQADAEPDDGSDNPVLLEGPTSAAAVATAAMPTATAAPASAVTLHVKAAASRKYLYRRHQALLGWLLGHFGIDVAATRESVFGAGRPVSSLLALRNPPLPVYFQHDGHSRTLIGVELRRPVVDEPKPAAPRRRRDRSQAALQRVGGGKRGRAADASVAAVARLPSSVDRTSSALDVDDLPLHFPVADDDVLEIDEVAATTFSGAPTSTAAALPDADSPMEIDVSVCADAAVAPAVSRRPAAADESTEYFALADSLAEFDVNLIILDPGTASIGLKNALVSGKAWEAVVKRGLHTLRKPVYEIVLVDDDAVLPMELRDALKVLTRDELS